MAGIVYLAVPYSHDDPEVRRFRFEEVSRVAAKMMKCGIHVLSPISHTHPIAESGNLPKGWDFWGEYDRKLLSACASMVVLQMDGWKESKGIKAEIELAEELGIGITYLRHKTENE